MYDINSHRPTYSTKVSPSLVTLFQKKISVIKFNSLSGEV